MALVDVLRCAAQECVGSVAYVVLYALLDVVTGCSLTAPFLALHLATIVMFELASDGVVSNPSVSAALYLKGGVPLLLTVTSLASQFVGAYLAIPLLKMFLDSDVGVLMPAFDADLSVPAAMLLEGFFGIYLFGFFVLEQVFGSINDFADSKQSNAAGTACTICGSASFNPIYALAFAFWSADLDQKQALSYAAVYLLSPTIGAILAVGMYKLLFGHEKPKTE